MSDWNDFQVLVNDQDEEKRKWEMNEDIVKAEKEAAGEVYQPEAKEWETLECAPF